MRIDGAWSLRQSNDATVSLDLQQFTLADGTEKLAGTAHVGGMHGRVDGTVKGDSTDFHIYWDANIVGRYRASLDERRFLLGTTYDVTKPQQPASWLSDRSF